ncbi:hypothetical protein TWF481_006780 [Arthrobotrys musiformis]|uniref:HbrB-like protein n=1 Tax=Arthrobotrys musiformis TaxID=47236 RepID=A0AAV9W9I8_9PEZI
MPPVAPHRRTHQRTPALTRSPSADSSSDSSTSTTNTIVSTAHGLVRQNRNHDQGAGYFEPSLTTTSQVAAAAAVARESARKHSQSDPSPPTPGTAASSSMPLSAAGAAALAAMPKTDKSQSTGQEKEKKESKMKIFSKPLRAAQSSQAMKIVDAHAHVKPLPSPSKLAAPMPRMPSVSSADGSRRPSFTSTISDTLYSSSPPTSSHSHKHHLLLRGRKEQPLSSANSNSKLVSEGSSIYNFNPNSPSTANFPVPGSANPSQKTLVTNADIKHVVGVVSGKDKDAVGEQVLEEVWPLLKARVLPLFNGEGLRTPVEDLNKLVIVHIKHQVDKKAAILLIDDIQSLLEHGMATLDNSLVKLADVRLIPRLVELWNFVFSTVLPYFEAAFLPLQQEFKGIGTVLSSREAREVWGTPDQRLDLRRMALISYRDSVILPLYNRLHAIFSKLQLDFDALPNVTETVGRVLQCVSVLASILSNDDKQAKMDELAKTMKHNWLGRGRTGRNRRGFVGTKMRALGSASSLGSNHGFGDLTVTVTD